MHQFKTNKAELERDLERFISLMAYLMPRYSLLLDKKKMDKEETTELGEIEHFLIEVNAQISRLKLVLEQDLFGHSLIAYCQLKKMAILQEGKVTEKTERLKKQFEQMLEKGVIFNWN